MLFFPIYIAIVDVAVAVAVAGGCNIRSITANVAANAAPGYR